MQHGGNKKLSKYDTYWLLRQVMSGYSIKEIASALGNHPISVYGFFKKRNIVIAKYTKKIKPFKLPKDIGLSEIARELGISRQRVSQKVKQCRSPYIHYPCTGRRKKAKMED